MDSTGEIKEEKEGGREGKGNERGKGRRKEGKGGKERRRREEGKKRRKSEKEEKEERENNERRRERRREERRKITKKEKKKRERKRRKEYQRPSLWIGIGTLHFGLVSAPFTLNWYRRDPSRIGETLSHKSVRPFTLDRYRRDPSSIVLVGTFGNLWYRLRPLETCGISCYLWKPVVSVATFGNLCCYLWKPVVSVSIGWNLLDRCQLGPLETKPVIYGFLVLSELNFKGQQLFG
ncbi:unnamed protein product [Rhizophagus irregularis]|nr:unnamed protein product [Rhizophagus irregularis]